jgi:DNA repair protein RecO (recombination protein O)
VPEIKTAAIVLRTYDLAESDRLVRLYTERLGRVSAIAKGARRSRRRFPGTLDTLTVIEARLADVPRSPMMRLDGARVREPFEPLARDLVRFGIASQLIEILDRATGEREVQEGLFRFAAGVLGVLREEPADSLLALLVLAKTFAWLGYRPQLASCGACGRAIARGAELAFDPRSGGVLCESCSPHGAPTLAARVWLAIDRGIGLPLRARATLSLGEHEVREVTRVLVHFFHFHSGVELRTPAFVASVLDDLASSTTSDEAARSAASPHDPMHPEVSRAAPSSTHRASSQALAPASDAGPVPASETARLLDAPEGHGNTSRDRGETPGIVLANDAGAPQREPLSGSRGAGAPSAACAGAALDAVPASAAPSEAAGAPREPPGKGALPSPGEPPPRYAMTSGLGVAPSAARVADSAAGDDVRGVPSEPER